jgi:hypothetical protein
MAQDLRQVSPDKLRLQIYALSVSQIKQLIGGIYEYKRSIKDPTDEIVMDLERKETILEAELIRRGYFLPKKNQGELQDYNTWKLKMASKKRLF